MFVTPNDLNFPQDFCLCMCAERKEREGQLAERQEEEKRRKRDVTDQKDGRIPPFRPECCVQRNETLRNPFPRRQSLEASFESGILLSPPAGDTYDLIG